MKQFNLSEWLKDKSRKVVTRDGRPVRILDYNVKGDKHICIAVDDEIQESITTVDEDGHCLRDKTGWHESNFDLFFADEKEELTEFEKCVQNILNEPHFQDIEAVKQFSKTLLDLARKEPLKDLPKWKKATEKKDLEKHIAILEENKVLLSNYLEEGDYYIDLEDLKTLPKEE